MNRILLLALATLAVCAANVIPTRNLLHPIFGYPGRIVGGEPIEIKEAPFQVLVQYMNVKWCGGSIISSRFILTAAHCMKESSPDSFTVRMGTKEANNGGVVMKVKKIHQHKEYNSTTTDYDYSVLELEEEITFTENIQPIALPKQGEPVADGVMLDVSGWGNTQNPSESSDILRKTVVAKLNEKECYKAYVQHRGITDRMICAGFQKGGKDACQGDSGGPLSVNNTLVGVVSWGMGCALPNYPGVYSRVAYVVDWILDIMKSE